MPSLQKPAPAAAVADAVARAQRSQFAVEANEQNLDRLAAQVSEGSEPILPSATKSSLVHSFDQYLVYENADFRAEQSSDCSIPGYLILSTKEPVGSITSLTIAALEGFGPTLAVLIDAIETVVRPDLVYFARFGEEVKLLHCHLFPRTASLAAEFLAAGAEGDKLNGPLLLNWARMRYASVSATAAQRARVMEATHAIREHLRAASLRG